MRKIFKYPYLFLLTISFLAVGAAWNLGWITFSKEADLFSQTPAVTDDSAAFDGTPADFEKTEITPAHPSDSFQQDLPDHTESPAVNTSDDVAAMKVPVFFEADRSYFDDALFIGDSRTVGLYEYGDLGNSVVLADSGMSVYKLFQQSFRLSSGETVTLDTLLKEKHFGKIYIMLGINELGYSFETTVKRYREMVSTIRSEQPDALIILQANLHIAGKKSASSDIYNNTNINRFNAEVQKLAEENSDIYLDINELFDDSHGNLDEQYTADQSHVLGKYYADWTDWLLKHAVTFEYVPVSNAN